MTLTSDYLKTHSYVHAGMMISLEVLEMQKHSFSIPAYEVLHLSTTLEASNPYQSHVHMFPSEEEPNTFLGDMSALQKREIAGICEGVELWKIPCVLLSHVFFGRSTNPVIPYIAWPEEWYMFSIRLTHRTSQVP